MKTIFKFILFCILAFLVLMYGLDILSGAIWFVENIYRGDPPVPKACEIVMEPNTRITATTSVGTIKITSGNGLKRYYTWDGVTRSVVMDSRDSRWNGSLGVYYPGPGFHWWPHNGIARGVVEEGQQHFKSVPEALKWLNKRTWMPYVYRDDGLVVGWQKYLSRYQLNVDVWQIYINGSKPTTLPGSQNDKIIIENLK